jgi:hypothetical protein
MKTINNGKRFLIITDGTQKGKEILSSIDMFNHGHDENSITNIPIQSSKINTFSQTGTTHKARFVLITDPKPFDTNLMAKKDTDPRPDRFYFESPFTILDMPNYVKDITPTTPVDRIFKTLPHYYREMPSWEILDWVDKKQSLVIYGIDGTTLKSISPADMLKNMFFMYLNGGSLYRCDNDKIVESKDKLITVFTVNKLENTSIYVMITNSEIIQEKISPHTYCGDVQTETCKQENFTFKHEFLNSVFFNVDYLAGKYDLHVSQDTFSMEIFSPIEKYEWENNATLYNHIEKIPDSIFDIETTIPFSVNKVLYGAVGSYRITFDVTGLKNGQKTYMKVKLNLGKEMDALQKSNKMYCEFIINKTSLVPNNPEIFDRYDANGLLIDGIAKNENQTVDEFIKDLSKVQFIKD